MLLETFRVTPFDLRSFGRSFAIASVVTLLGVAVMISTDGEQGASGSRIARLGALAPVFGAMGSALALAQARARGELLALSCLGVRPWRAHVGAWLAAFLFGIAGALGAVAQPSALDSLFPRLPTSDWLRSPDGTWFSPSGGIVVGLDGIAQATFVVANPMVASWHAPRVAVLLSIAAAGVVLPVWLESQRRWSEKMSVAAIAILAEIAAFHYVGAERVGGWALAIGPALILAHRLVGR
jgi:hypothetical protein